MVVSFQKFDCAAAVKTINVSKTEASVPVPHLQKKASTSQLFSFLKDSPDVIASGTSGTCKWEITADGILTIDSGQLATGTVPYSVYDPTNGTYTLLGGSNWTANGNEDKIKKVEIKPGVSLPKDATAVFANLPNVTEIEGLENLDTSETTNMTHLFDDCYDLISLDLSKFNNSQVTDMSYLFKDCKKLSSLNLNNFSTSQVTNMSSMFTGCGGLTSLNLSNFDTHNVTNMNSMFSGSYVLTTLDLSNFNTSRVTDMGAMFSGCNGLKSLNVSKFDTSQVTKMNSMFSNCYILSSINVSNFNTGKVTDMSYMFFRCSALTSLNVNNFNTSKVTDMSSMFAVCSGLISLNLSNFDTSKVTRIYEMFKSCSQLQILDISSFDTRKAADYINGGWMLNLFDYDTKLWQLKIGKNFKPYVNIYTSVGSWPWPPTEFPQVFHDGGLRYITIGNNAQEFQWSEVGTGSPHNPKGKNFNTYVKFVGDSNGRYTVNLRGIEDLIANHDSDEPITLVWNNRPYNASPSLTFTDSSYRNPVISGNPYVYPYAYLPDDSRFCNPESYPALNIYGTLRDEDSSQVTLSYWIDDDSTNKKEVKTVDTTSSNGEKNETKVNWSFAITDENDLKALATPKEDGHTIHVEARDNGIDGQSQEVFKPASATFEVPVAENAIVQFDYQDLSGNPLLDSQTLVRGATESNKNYSDGYGYDVKQYVPQYLWRKDKDNNLQRYSLSNYDYNKLISDNCDWGHINSYISIRGNLKSTGAQLKKIPLKYDKSGTISLEVPHLNFGSYIRQVIPSKLGLKYPVKEQPRLIVRDTTYSFVRYWKLDLSITKFTNTKDSSKTLDGIFNYDDTPVDSGSEATIAKGSNFSDSNITDCDISKNWYENNGTQVKLRDYYRGPWLNLQDQRPAEGTYKATATWTLNNTLQ